jgi:hypothetical protein
MKLMEQESLKDNILMSLNQKVTSPTSVSLIYFCNNKTQVMSSDKLQVSLMECI